MIPAETENLPKGSVISVIGAGGKTTCVHFLAESYRRKGYKVLVTTSTHMLEEEGTKTGTEEILAALKEGYAFAGTPTEKNGLRKIRMLPKEVLSACIGSADITLIEADGAAGKSFKAPKETEPVILPETTQIVLIAGMKSVGRSISEACYNPEAVCAALGRRPEDILTPELMAEVYRKTYLRRLLKECPGIPVWTAAGQDTDGILAEYGRQFEKIMKE
ncbi:MAG: putative selenium-dependent hydroxylase accessory protein YqeC [Lachnospiraceae bacterium]|jgi:probable selenium-dependent hydroxylase accessory protein YqeC|nr:putative selenium-dependent hydroxylase accessory protein YqeC [Lachnospiraceae bacterium]